MEIHKEKGKGKKERREGKRVKKSTQTMEIGRQRKENHNELKRCKNKTRLLIVRRDEWILNMILYNVSQGLHLQTEGSLDLDSDFPN